MGLLVRIVFVAGVATIVALIATDLFGQKLGTTDYWSVHGFWLLLFLALFPRLTLLFSSIPFGGVLWWLGWIFAPRLLVAMLATLAYWNTNPILVGAAWLCAIGGESGEKIIFERRLIRSRT